MKRVFACVVAVLLMFVSGASALAAGPSATTLRLVKHEGTVKVTSKNGKELKKTDNMKLYNAYGVTTSEKSYAYISLDDSKAVKLDAGTQVEIRKSGKKLEVHLITGNIFCNVTAPLKKDEELKITTSTTITGIRGTSLGVSASAEGTSIQVYSGHVVTAVYDALNGLSDELVVSPGEKMSVSADGGTPGVDMTKLSIDDVPGFIAVMLQEDPELRRIMDSIGIDSATLVSDAVTRLKNEQDAKSGPDTGNTSRPSSNNSGGNNNGGNNNGGNNNGGNNSGGNNSGGNNSGGNNSGGNSSGGNSSGGGNYNVDFDMSQANAADNLQALLDSSAANTGITLYGTATATITGLKVPKNITLTTNGVMLKLAGNNYINGIVNIIGGSLVNANGNVSVNGTLNIRGTNSRAVVIGNASITSDGTMNIEDNGKISIHGNMIIEENGTVTGSYEVEAASTSIYYYGTWSGMAASFADAANAVTIKLNKDIETSTPLKCDGNVEIDGNGKSITFTTPAVAAVAAIGTSGALTVSDITITGGDGYDAVLAANTAELQNSSTVYATNTNGTVMLLGTADAGGSASVSAYSRIYAASYVVRKAGTASPTNILFESGTGIIHTSNEHADLGSLFEDCTSSGSYVKYGESATAVTAAEAQVVLEPGDGYWQVTLAETATGTDGGTGEDGGSEEGG